MRFAENAMPRSNIHEAPSVGGLEEVEDDACGTYRVLYTVKFDVAVFFLHCFQNKSERGIATLKEDMNIIRARLQVAEVLVKKPSHGKTDR